MEQIEIEIDVKTKTKAKKAMSRLRLRSMLKSMKKEGLIMNYEITHWTYDDESSGIGETVLTSAESKEEDEDE